ncbi:DUF2844 domain-containing protein [Paraburkholderia guartelaensis]|uniref:DUF2844 domain-containing protein n=1 Tax=Paraburkholderia guartelaensis TaxID=2546446 RepID=UPI002AB5E827|nr:DUF2844 domain-containing protein [Paraburkholderia guartelaensis]
MRVRPYQFRGKRAFLIAVLAGVASFAICESSAQAALGGKIDSLQIEASALRGQLSSTASTSTYTTQVITLPTGTTVREYANAAGQVFAVSWSGPRPPDLSQLFGTYFSEYKAALQTPTHADLHRHVAVESAQMRYVGGGRMNNMRGTAWLPAAVPAGVTPEDLQ